MCVGRLKSAVGHVLWECTSVSLVKLLSRTCNITCTNYDYRYCKQKYQGLSKNVLQAMLDVKESSYYRNNMALLVEYKQKASRKPVYLLLTDVTRMLGSELTVCSKTWCHT